MEVALYSEEGWASEQYLTLVLQISWHPVNIHMAFQKVPLRTPQAALS